METSCDGGYGPENPASARPCGQQKPGQGGSPDGPQASTCPPEATNHHGPAAAAAHSSPSVRFVVAFGQEKNTKTGRKRQESARRAKGARATGKATHCGKSSRFKACTTGKSAAASKGLSQPVCRGGSGRGVGCGGSGFAPVVEKATPMGMKARGYDRGPRWQGVESSGGDPNAEPNFHQTVRTAAPLVGVARPCCGDWGWGALPADPWPS